VVDAALISSEVLLLPLGKCTGISSPITLSIRVLGVRPFEPVTSERVLAVCPMERALGACPIAVPGPPSERAELGRLAHVRGLLFPDRSPGLPTKPSVVWADHGRVRVVMPGRFISFLSDARGTGAYYQACATVAFIKPSDPALYLPVTFI
jgi:hypothetical protein